MSTQRVLADDAHDVKRKIDAAMDESQLLRDRLTHALECMAHTMNIITSICADNDLEVTYDNQISILAGDDGEQVELGYYTVEAYDNLRNEYNGVFHSHAYNDVNDLTIEHRA